MRFRYSPETGQLNIFVKKDEFDLAVSENEYRVFTRDFTKVNISVFVEEFSNFVKEIFQSLYAEEKLKDIVAVSTVNGAYTWISLLKLEDTGSANDFLENLLSYGLNVLDKESLKKKKDFLYEMTVEDRAKLSLILGLLHNLSYPAPWKKRTKDNKLQKNINRLKLLKRQLGALESKYGFSSEEMVKYYADDTIPDEDIVAWLILYNEYQELQHFSDKQDVLKQIIDIWIKSDVVETNA